MNAPAPDRYQALRNLFLQEMHALQEEGKAFAQEYPEAAALLDPTRVEDRDPGVERMVEAFSYLTARVREASAMEQDGLEGHLLELLEDGLDHILPSVVVFQVAARRKFRSSTGLSRGAEFKTPGSRTSSCRFTLLHDLRIDPVEIVRAQVELDERGTSSLELEFKRADPDGGDWPDALPVFLHGDAPVVWSLRYGLSRRAAKIDVWTENGWHAAPGIRFQALDKPGYDADLRAHPLSHARDFFCCDERFRFVELRGLSSLAAPGDGTLRLRVAFDGAFPRAVVRGVSADAFRLHAGVAVNRYEDSCDGLVWDHTRSEVPLRTANGNSQEILEALKVESSTRSHPPRHTRYFPFSRYRHGTLADAAFFGLHRRRDASGRPLSLLALGWPDLGTPLEDEYVSVHAAFCDGNRPYEETTGKEFLPSDPDLREALDLATLTRPTPVHRPPPQVALHTRLMTMAMIHFQGILDAERMRDALRLFLWDPAEGKKTLIDSIQQVSVETGHRYVDGIHRPEQRVRIRLRDTTCTPETWERLGVLDAFARILGRMVQEETPIGSLCATTVVIEPAGVELRV
ncbi:MAG TPA: type VI secretion system baseplate subunit TssF [Fibrobacteria bacterium]|nr:type VI secretion system baseplate subunit TssF [Fibrobacteria bacterium]